MIGYGVASRAMYDYDAAQADENNYKGNLTFDGRSVFRHILYPSYYLMYGVTDDEFKALDRKICQCDDRMRHLFVFFKKIPMLEQRLPHKFS